MAEGEFDIDEHIKKMYETESSFGVVKDPKTGAYVSYPRIPKGEEKEDFRKKPKYSQEEVKKKVDEYLKLHQQIHELVEKRTSMRDDLLEIAFILDNHHLQGSLGRVKITQYNTINYDKEGRDEIINVLKNRILADKFITIQPRKLAKLLDEHQQLDDDLKDLVTKVTSYQIRPFVRR